MDPERFQRAAELFLRARALGLSEREELLANECANDAALRASVEGLLAGAESQLPFAELAAELGGALAPLAIDGAPPPESRIGPYRLLEKLGEGGFGVVFMAEQTEPVRRQVALKVVRQGLDSRQVIARFEAERQALALMDHPNITRVLDAGATQNGRPYFVMELIRGLPITKFCDKNQLGTRERVELLLQVCHAVHHAHQKGILHRDLKPSNVLVSQQDGGPVPKVIDFGIAKALHAPLTDRTLFTEFRQVMGTPEYMSPEQAESPAIDVDTRTDVYSLGVLLYELLTGTTPLDSETLRKADYGEMQRLIREVEPPTPSRRLNTLCGQGGHTPAQPTTQALEIARARASDPVSLGRQLRGELDWIVMKCLEKDRRRRYESASALAADLGHFLADEPVSAGPPSTLYRMRKLAKRHRLLVAGVGVAVLAVGVAFAGVVWGLVNAVHERDLARESNRAALQSSRENLALFNAFVEMVRVGGPRGLSDESYTVESMLADFQADIGRRLADFPSKEVDLRIQLGSVFEIAGRMNGFVDQMERAVQRAREAWARDDPQLSTAIELLAYARFKTLRPAEALRLADEAIALRGRAGPESSTSWLVLTGSHALLGQHAAAEEAAAQALDVAARAFGAESPEHTYCYSALAVARLQAGRVDEALPMLARSAELRARFVAPEHQSVRNAQALHAHALVLLGELDAAERELADVARRQDEFGRPGEFSRSAIAAARAACALERGHGEQAVAILEELVERDARDRQADDPFRARDRLDLAEMLLACGRGAEAAALVRTEEERAAGKPATVLVPRTRCLRAVCKRLAGDLGGACADLEALLEEQRRTLDSDSPYLATILEAAAEAFLEADRAERAHPYALEAHAIRERHPFPRWRVLYDQTLVDLAHAPLEPTSRAAFLDGRKRLEAEPGLPPLQRAVLDAGVARLARAHEPTANR